MLSTLRTSWLTTGRIGTAEVGVSLLLWCADTGEEIGILLSNLFRQQAVHDKNQCSLQAVEDSKEVCCHCCTDALFKQKGPKHPHQTQYTQLGNSCHCESPAEEEGEGWEWDQRKGNRYREKERLAWALTRGWLSYSIIWKTPEESQRKRKGTGAWAISHQFTVYWKLVEI